MWQPADHLNTGWWIFAGQQIDVPPNLINKGDAAHSTSLQTTTAQWLIKWSYSASPHDRRHVKFTTPRDEQTHTHTHTRTTSLLHRASPWTAPTGSICAAQLNSCLLTGSGRVSETLSNFCLCPPPHPPHPPQHCLLCPHITESPLRHTTRCALATESNIPLISQSDSESRLCAACVRACVRCVCACVRARVQATSQASAVTKKDDARSLPGTHFYISRMKNLMIQII